MFPLSSIFETSTAPKITSVPIYYVVLKSYCHAVLLRTLHRTLQLLPDLARETDQLTKILRIYDGGRRSGM